VELTPNDKRNLSMINKPTDIPSNFTLLGKFFKMSTADPFKKKQQWNNKKDGGDKHRDEEDDKIYAKAIYGTIRLTPSIPIEDLVSAVQMEWQAKGGLCWAFYSRFARVSAFSQQVFKSFFEWT